ncbi:hypothetical protein [Methyloceanibacter caenitepidi]|uniref:Uncharacterized protein n=1 Tax=Methyloceanibacter caenitepidi TaxID=1384459 RepID=A0A0A8K629_9HYPH|nr:hypothetical protein [Methyloceanibacter caenitepidi]BAQ17454.1 hypothetical protein GL4_2005 [Methyloceanibacter caenitepidi]
MKLYSITKSTVRAYVIAYFARGRRMPTPGMNVRRAYGYSDRAWAEVANDINKYGWMDQLGVLLDAHEMAPLKTVEEIVDLIWSKRSARKAGSGTRTRKSVRTAQTAKRNPRAPKSRRRTAIQRKPTTGNVAESKKAVRVRRRTSSREKAAHGER